MPRLSESMTEGKLLLWCVQPGDYVTEGTQIAEIEADKANMEIEAPADGVVVSLFGKSGDTIAVDVVLAQLDDTVVGTSSAAKPMNRTDNSETVESALDKRLQEFQNDSTER